MALTTVQTGLINATGTADSSTYLRGDGTWASITSSQWTSNGTSIYYNTGNVGIGTSNTNGLLTLKNQNPAVNLISIQNYASSGELALIKLDQATDTWSFTNKLSAGSIAFGTNNTDQMKLTSAGLLQFNSGYGSVATAYGCRAWVNFNGTGTVAIRGSGNVSSITDNGTGDYTVNFTTAMPDANYGAVFGSSMTSATDNDFKQHTSVAPTVSAIRVVQVGTSYQDPTYCYVSIFR